MDHLGEKGEGGVCVGGEKRMKHDIGIDWGGGVIS